MIRRARIDIGRPDTDALEVALRQGFLGAPQLLARFMSARSDRSLVRASLPAVVCVIIFDVGAIFSGMAGRALFPELGDHESVLPVMSQTLLHPVFTAIFFIAVLAAMMSTVDSLLIMASSTLIRDVLQKTMGSVASDARLAMFGKVSTVVLGLVAVAAVIGLLQHRPYGRPLAAWTGLVVAIGFVAYHAVPWTTAATNPYLGEPVGAPAWLSVAAAVAAGLWCAYEGRAELALVSEAQAQSLSRSVSSRASSHAERDEFHGLPGSTHQKQLQRAREKTVTEQTEWFNLTNARCQLLPYSKPYPEIAVASVGPRLVGDYKTLTAEDAFRQFYRDTFEEELAGLEEEVLLASLREDDPAEGEETSRTERSQAGSTAVQNQKAPTAATPEPVAEVRS